MRITVLCLESKGSARCPILEREQPALRARRQRKPMETIASRIHQLGPIKGGALLHHDLTVATQHKRPPNLRRGSVECPAADTGTRRPFVELEGVAAAPKNHWLGGRLRPTVSVGAAQFDMWKGAEDADVATVAKTVEWNGKAAIPIAEAALMHIGTIPVGQFNHPNAGLCVNGDNQSSARIAAVESPAAETIVTLTINLADNPANGL